MLVSTWYRGVHVRRFDGVDGAWMAGGNPDQPMSWNGALAWIDGVADLPPVKSPLHDGSPFYCSYCGERELLGYVHNKRLIQRKLCFHCNFWTDVVGNVGRSPRRVFVANGSAYTIATDDEKSPGSCRGFGGHRFVVQWPDGTETVTRNLWAQGPIPKHWRDQLPDTAILKANR